MLFGAADGKANAGQLTEFLKAEENLARALEPIAQRPISKVKRDERVRGTGEGPSIKLDVATPNKQCDPPGSSPQFRSGSPDKPD